MDWGSIIKTVGGASVIITAVAWLARSIVRSLIDRDLERFRTLHSRRSELLAELYQKMFILHGAISRLLWEYKTREIREQVDRESFLYKRAPWELKPGFELLNAAEENAIKELKDRHTEFYQFFGSNRIFFPTATCAVIDRFSSLSGFLSMNYRDVTYKDKDGNLYVHPDVKKTWDASVDLIPQLLKDIEKEFRTTLGSSK